MPSPLYCAPGRSVLGVKDQGMESVLSAVTKARPANTVEIVELEGAKQTFYEEISDNEDVNSPASISTVKAAASSLQQLELGESQQMDSASEQVTTMHSALIVDLDELS